MLFLLAVVVPVMAQQGHTDPEVFADTIRGLSVQYTIGFDAQSPGTSAARYGITRIAATGLASDGATTLTLSPVSSDALPAQTIPNTLGTDYEGQQFLAGNSDVITFSFDYPVLAFGCYLIGNPSPTGDPPIPFWRMRIDGGFEAFSSTEPLATLEPGSDLYFLGVTAKKPFTTVELFSDNDPAAVFSFNVDTLVWATRATETDIAGAKSLSTGTGVVVPDVIVTRVHADRFNVETEDRQFGIAVIGTGVSRGDKVTILGRTTITDPDDERVLDLLQILSALPSSPPRPLGMRTTALGGSPAFGYQVGCVGSYGPNNIGLDVRVWGTITAIAPDFTWFTLDDGADRLSGARGSGVVVMGAISANKRRVGDIVAVTGSVSLFESETGHYPLIRVADKADILTLKPAP